MIPHTFTASDGLKLAYYKQDFTQFADNGKTVGNLNGAPSVQHAVTYDAWLPSIDAHYRARSYWSMYAQYGRGQNIPPTSIWDVQGALVSIIPKPILTDSGGYQVFSLSARRTISEEGAHFRSHLDGSAHLLTPEKVADIQAQLGSDVAMVLDECLAHPSDENAARHSMERTLRWACRARDRFLALRDGMVPGVTVSNPGQAQFGIVQGSVFPGLREESARQTVEIGFEASVTQGCDQGIEDVGDGAADDGRLGQRARIWLVLERTPAVELELVENMCGRG